MAGFIGAALCTVAVALPAQAQLGEAQKVKVSSTGLGAERIKTVPIGKRSGQKPRVVMSLSPDQLGRIDPGDSVWVGGEVEVSTTCLEPMRQCIGRIYHFSPTVRLRAVLAGSSKATQGVPVGGSERLRCSQKLPHRNHHCVIVLEGTTDLKSSQALPCSPNCNLNLVVDASHPGARRGQVLVVGVDTNAGTVSQKKGTLSAAVSRPGLFPAVAPIVQTKPSRRRLAVGAQYSGAGGEKKVVMSRRLDNLREGEQLVVDTRLKVKTGHLPYGTLLQSFLVLSEKPYSASRVGLPSKVASFKGKITAQNGFNCTRGRSGHRSPCLIRKVGVVRILRDVRARPDARHEEDRGPFQPLYVNLVMQSAAQFGGHRHRRSDTAKIASRGSLAVTRFGAELG